MLVVNVPATTLPIQGHGSVRHRRLKAVMPRQRRMDTGGSVRAIPDIGQQATDFLTNHRIALAGARLEP